jgi:membrane-associated protein
MDFLHRLFDTIFDLSPDKLDDFMRYIGVGNLYIVLFLIMFAETGLVITPFLPGDSLLFAVGAVGHMSSTINLPMLSVLLIVAVIVGDACNYWIGYKFGPAIFKREDSRLLNKKHLLRAQEFYEKYGGKTIILARFVPIIRTFAPFVAGIGRMNFFRFWVYNITGGILWIVVCVGAGYLFGGIKWVQENFEVVVLAIIAISVLPVVIEVIRAKLNVKKGESALLEATTIGDSSDMH